jgi:hypothetical protein
LGSAASLFIGLSLTAIVFLFLPEYSERLEGEWRPLLTGIVWTCLLTAVAAASFVGELRRTRWRRAAQVLLVVGTGLVLWRYLP